MLPQLWTQGIRIQKVDISLLIIYSLHIDDGSTFVLVINAGLIQIHPVLQTWCQLRAATP